MCVYSTCTKRRKREFTLQQDCHVFCVSSVPCLCTVIALHMRCGCASAFTMELMNRTRLPFVRAQCGIAKHAMKHSRRRRNHRKCGVTGSVSGLARWPRDFLQNKHTQCICLFKTKQGNKKRKAKRNEARSRREMKGGRYKEQPLWLFMRPFDVAVVARMGQLA